MSRTTMFAEQSLYGVPSFQQMNETYLRRLYPEDWAAIDAERALFAEAKRNALYFEPYLQATGEFLEYACGRPIGGQ